MINDVPTRVFYVSREFEPVVCDNCGCLVTKINSYHTRKVKIFINYDYPVLLYYKQRRLICDCGKTMNENNSIVGYKKGISNYLRLEILKQCKYKHSFTTIARQLNLDTTTVINVFMENANFERREFGEVICVDEFSAYVNEDNPYACIIGDPITKEIIDILPSRHQEYIDRYLGKIPREERIKVKIVNIDMWEAYKTTFSAYCPNAKIAVDPFHWIKKATDNFHKIRREIEEQTNNPKVKSILRSHWKLFSLKEKKLSNKLFYSRVLNKHTCNRELVEYCINSDTRLEDAWILLQRIIKMRDKCDANSVRAELKEIIQELEKTENFHLIGIAKTYRHWFNEICNSFLTFGTCNKKTSNAFIEGKNRLVKEIKAFSCGFNNFAIYRARVLYISSKTPLSFKKGGDERKLYSKEKKRRK